MTRSLCLGENKLVLREKFKTLGEGDVLFKRLEYRGNDVAVISLTNVKNRNAMSGKMMVKLAKIVDELEQWKDGKAVILTGENGTFCSGADLMVARRILTHEEGEMMSSLMHDTVLRFKSLPFISVAAIQGQALGGGAELLLCCDFRLMANDSEIQFVQARLGVTPGWGGGTQLVNLVGRQQALKILMSCMKIDAKQAMSMGLADGIIPENTDGVESTCEWLLPYLKAPPAVIHAMKKVVLGESNEALQKTLDIERSIFKTMWSGKDNLRALEKGLKHR